MLRLTNPNQLYIEDFKMQFGGKLRADNRWVKLSRHMPWERIEEIYARNFSPDSGAVGISSRIAFGSIYAKEQEEWTDRETVQNIMENPYLQYFLGYTEFKQEEPFDASMMVHFRKRFPVEAVNEINELIFISIAREAGERKVKNPPSGTGTKRTFRSVMEMAKKQFRKTAQKQTGRTHPKTKVNQAKKQGRQAGPQLTGLRRIQTVMGQMKIMKTRPRKTKAN